MFQDTSTDCAICLEPLYDDDSNTADDSSNVVAGEMAGLSAGESPKRKVITLRCGHKWHYDCLVQQLQTAQPSSTKRLLFTGCQCAKCSQICDHPELENLTRTTDRLRVKVDELIEEQLKTDIPEIWKQIVTPTVDSTDITNNNNNNINLRKASLLDDARRKYAFYLCGHCGEPYFGGTVDCADQQFADDDGENQEQQQKQRLCVACAPQSQMVCRNPLEHGRYLIWKCRYCCQPATHVCYGNVHFCNSCHQRNSDRVREAQGSTRPPRLEPIPCLRLSCPFPKVHAADESIAALEGSRNRLNHQHLNGPTLQCEQVYSCTFCASNDDRALHQHEAGLSPGSFNLLKNPSGQDGLQGWSQLRAENPRRGLGYQTMSWQVETSDLPVNGTTTTNFVSSCLPCIMYQSLNLQQVLKPSVGPDDDHVGSQRTTHQPIRFEISARYMGRTDCPSVFRLEATLVEEYGSILLGHSSQQQRRTLQQVTTPTLEAPPDFWEYTSLDIEISSDEWLRLNSTPNTYIQLYVTVYGKDTRFWAGNFGSKVADISVRVLGTPDDVAAILNPEIAVRQQGQQPSTPTSTNQQHNDRDQQSPRRRSEDHRGRQNHLPNNAGNTAAAVATTTTSTMIGRPSKFRIIFDALVPIVCFLVLAWMAKDGDSKKSKI
jgi:hypothetical protein